MSYSRAIELLGHTTPKSAEAAAHLARLALKSMTPATPLRYKVACQVIIAAAK